MYTNNGNSEQLGADNLKHPHYQTSTADVYISGRLLPDVTDRFPKTSAAIYSPNSDEGLDYLRGIVRYL